MQQGSEPANDFHTIHPSRRRARRIAGSDRAGDAPWRGPSREDPAPYARTGDEFAARG